jgi:anionic cell wall polymer biosynthesis LytR-Cps2A-Psr (LCP) family protein
VADLVDAVGGVTVDVQEEEISQLNKYTIQTANNIGQTSYDLVEAAGEQTLEGVQAVSYGRIRKGVGDDYKRTERMRTVLTKVFEKLKTMSVKKLDDLLDMMLPQVQTNLSNSDLLTLAMRLANFNISSGAGWPYDVTSGYIGQVSYVFADDLLSNTVKLHQEMFGQTDYSPSDMVVNMNSVIAGNISASVTNQQIVDTASGETTDKVDNQQEDPVVEQPTEEELSQQKPSKGETGETGGENSGGSGDGEVVTPTPDPEPTPEPEVPDQAEDSAAEASTLQTES